VVTKYATVATLGTPSTLITGVPMRATVSAAKMLTDGGVTEAVAPAEGVAAEKVTANAEQAHIEKMMAARTAAARE